MNVKVKYPSNIISRLKRLGFPFLADIANTPWLVAILIQLLPQIAHGYRQLWLLPIEFNGRFDMMIGQISIKFGTRWEKKDTTVYTACALRVVRV